jgi:protein-S-isoprenylcysteine O-methyltransferase Ste14
MPDVAEQDHRPEVSTPAAAAASGDLARVALRVAVATVAFGVVHSLLASQEAKALAARALGARRRDATYRIFFNAQAIVTFALLVRYGAGLPAHTLHRVHGPAAALLRAGQVGGLAWLWMAAREVGVLRLAGITALLGALREEPSPEGPAAQGPERGDDGALTTGGPFRFSRHPLNLSPLPVFWLTPHLTTRRLAFNVVATAYLVLGSMHEERRLRARYGDDYEAYRRSGVPFFLPRLALP